LAFGTNDSNGSVGNKSQDFKPRIHLTDSDFQSITKGLCKTDGELGPVEFEAVMRRQIKQVIQAKLALVGGLRSAEDLEFMQFGALKMVLLEQVRSEWNLNFCASEVGLQYCVY
jgi:hypothetical protein